jgi:hypothetical protein
VLAALRYYNEQSTQSHPPWRKSGKDLSGLFDLKIQTEEDYHPLHIDVCKSATGKGFTAFYVNFSVTQSSCFFFVFSLWPEGKTSRDKKFTVAPCKNLHLCAVGCQGDVFILSLLHGDFDPPPDFTDNNAWFFYQPLVPSDGVNSHGVAKTRYQCPSITYAEAMKRAFINSVLLACQQPIFGLG